MKFFYNSKLEEGRKKVMQQEGFVAAVSETKHGLEARVYIQGWIVCCKEPWMAVQQYPGMGCMLQGAMDGGAAMYRI
ncbi:MAG: hypothetical protein V7731_16670 [Amphritea sp.]